MAKRYECKYGQPFYPYLYIDLASKNRKPSSGPICVTMKVDRTLTTDECICGAADLAVPADSANAAVLSDAAESQCQRPLVAEPRSLVACYTCDLNSRSETQPNECRDRKCLGHFCVLELFTEYNSKIGKTVRRVAGCLNTTSPDFVRTGCDQQWIEGSKEVIQCACAGHFCNSDLQTAAQIGGGGGLGSLSNASFFSHVIWLFMTFLFAKSF